MKTLRNAKQTRPEAQNSSENQASIKFIKRSQSQAQTFQQNIHQYHNPQSQSLEKIQQDGPRKPLSRKNSQVGPRFRNQGQPQAREEAISIQQPGKKFVPKTVQDIAMHLASSIFMIATTKYVPGYDDLSHMKDASKSRNKRVSPIKGTTEKSVAPVTKKVAETPKKPISVVKENINSPAPSVTSIMNKHSPRMNNQLGNDLHQKSRLQQSLDSVSSQNTSNRSQPQVRIQEIQPSEVYHVPSGIRTKHHQPNYSTAKTERPFNPENSIHRVTGNVNVYGATTSRYNQQEAKGNNLSTSQPYKAQPIRTQPNPVTPNKPLQESIAKIGESPKKGATPIKSYIELQSRTDLPAVQPVKLPQKVSPEKVERTPVRNNRFQAEVAKEQAPARSVPKIPSIIKEQPKQISTARYGRQQAQKSPVVSPQKSVPKAQTQKSLPYKDSIYKPKGPPTKSVVSVFDQTPSGIRRNIEESAHIMVTQLFLSSTTKYYKQAKLDGAKKVVEPRYSKDKEGTKLKQQEESVLKQNQQEKSRPYNYSRDRVENVREASKTERYSLQKQTNQFSPNNKNPETERLQPKQALPVQERYGSKSPQKSVPQPSSYRAKPQTERKISPEENRAKNEPKKPVYEPRNIQNKVEVPSAVNVKKETPEPVNQVQNRYGYNLSRKQQNPAEVQEPKERNIGRVDSNKNIAKEDNTNQKGTPFTRQPAGNRSPILFTKSPEQVKQEAIKASKSNTPAFTQNKTQAMGSPIVRTEPSEKSIKATPVINKQQKVEAEPKQKPNPVPQAPIQRSPQANFPKKEPEPVKRPGGRPNPVNDDTSMKSVQNTTNTLAASKSTEAFPRVWKPSQPTRINNTNKVQLSTTVKPEETTINRAQPNRYQRAQEKPVQKVNEASKVQLQSKSSYLQKNNQTESYPQKAKTVPSEDVSIKRSPPSGYTPAPMAKNEAMAKTATTISPKASMIKPNVNAPVNTTAKNTYKSNYQEKTLPQVSSPQTSSAKVIGYGKPNQVKPFEKNQNTIKPAYGKTGVSQTQKINSQKRPVLELKETQQISKLKQATILAFASNAIIGYLAKNNLRAAFQKLKNNLLGDFKANKSVTIDSVSTKEKSANVICQLLKSKLRHNFKLFRTNMWALKQTSSLDSSQKVSEQKATKTHSQSLIRLYLTSLVSIAKAYQSSQLKKAFEKVYLSSATKGMNQIASGNTNVNRSKIFRSPSKILSYQEFEVSKKTISDTKAGLEADLTKLEYRLTEKKRFQDRERTKISKKIEELKKKNATLSTDFKQKKKTIQEFNSKNKDIRANQPPENQARISLLTCIYAEAFRSTDENFDHEKIMTKFSIDKDESNPTLEQWRQLLKNMELKSQIAKWQGVGSKEGKVRRSLKQEGQSQADLLKTYIRERYFWQWIHNTTIYI